LRIAASGQRAAVKEYVGVLRDAFKKGQNDQMTDRAAAMTYNTLMALFPGLILTASIIGLIGKGSTYDTIREQIELLPEQAAEAILPILDSAVNNQGTALVSFVISLVVGLNGASGALAAAGRGLNVVLGVKEDRGFVRRKVIDIGWTLLLILLTLVAFTLIGSGGAVAEWIFDQIGLGDVAVTIWTILRWPIAVAVAVAIFAIVYYVAPDAEERKFRFLSVGAFAASSSGSSPRPASSCTWRTSAATRPTAPSRARSSCSCGCG
jgi:membrane protein